MLPGDFCPGPPRSNELGLEVDWSLGVALRGERRLLPLEAEVREPEDLGGRGRGRSGVRAHP